MTPEHLDQIKQEFDRLGSRDVPYWAFEGVKELFAYITELEEDCRKLEIDLDEQDTCCMKQEKRIADLEAELRELVTVAHKHGWNGVENSKILSMFFDGAITDVEAKDEEIQRLRILLRQLIPAAQMTCALMKASDLRDNTLERIKEAEEALKPAGERKP